MYGGQQSENQRKRNERQVLGPCLRTKKAMEHENEGEIKCIWLACDSHKILGKGTGSVGNRRVNRDHPEHNFVKIVQNTG